MGFRDILKNYVPFLIFPLLIVILFFILPMDLQNRFAFNPTIHEWFTVFTASFFHNSLDHLTNNILAYIIASFALFLAFRYQSDTKNLFFLISACVLITPFFSSITTYFLIPTVPPGRGSSDIVFSVVGLFLVATMVFMNSRSWKVYIVGWLLLEITAYFYFLNQFLGAILVLLAYVVLFSFWGFKIQFFNKENYLKQVATLYALIITPFVLLFLGFPTVFVVNGSLVNVVAHFVGFQVGAAIGLVYLYQDIIASAVSACVSLIKR